MKALVIFHFTLVYLGFRLPHMMASKHPGPGAVRRTEASASHEPSDQRELLLRRPLYLGIEYRIYINTLTGV